MTCPCGVPALGMTAAGPRCHTCANWKRELQVYRDRKPKDAKGWPSNG